jgi:hypothetical protein
MAELSPAQIADMLEAASERGAKKALAQIGLADEDAHKDLMELRSLMDAYREIKRSMLATFGKVVAMGVVGAVVAYAWFRH